MKNALEAAVQLYGMRMDSAVAQMLQWLSDPVAASQWDSHSFGISGTVRRMVVSLAPGKVADAAFPLWRLCLPRSLHSPCKHLQNRQINNNKTAAISVRHKQTARISERSQKHQRKISWNNNCQSEQVTARDIRHSRLGSIHSRTRHVHKRDAEIYYFDSNNNKCSSSNLCHCRRMCHPSDKKQAYTFCVPTTTLKLQSTNSLDTDISRNTFPP